MKPYQARPYQDFATQRVLQLPAVGLFLDMGLGKTVSTLTAVSALMHDQFDIAKTLVIAPKRVAESVWDEECAIWEHLQYLRVSKVLGSERDRMRALSAEADVYAINRENVEWLVELYGKKWPFDMVVIDESSSFKSSKALRFRALRKVRPLIKRIVALTGTPRPNSLLDLWPQLYLLDQGERLGKTITGYRERYFEPDKRNRTTVFSWKPKPGAEEAIYAKISDICVSMSAKDWLDLPKTIQNIIPIHLAPSAMAKYKQLERDMLLPYADGDIVANNAAALSNKLLQLANGAVYDENGKYQVFHDEKLSALEEILEAANGEPVLVFYWYQHDLDRLRTRFPKARVLDTAQDIKDWNAGKVPLMLLHPASAGHGLNLQFGGHIAVWYSLLWSSEYYEQANKRLDRPGQTEAVILHHLVAAGTADEQAMQVLEGKIIGQNALMEAVKARIEKLSKGVIPA